MLQQHRELNKSKSAFPSLLGSKVNAVTARKSSIGSDFKEECLKQAPSSEGPLMTLLTFLHLAGNADLLALTIMQDPEVTSREEGTAG